VVGGVGMGVEDVIGEDRRLEVRRVLSEVVEPRHPLKPPVGRRSGRDAVEGMRASTLLTGDLVQSIGTLGEALAADASSGKRPDFGMRIEGRPRPLAPLLRDEVYRIAGEALHNAFRHAPAVRIEVDLRYDPHWFRF